MAMDREIGFKASAILALVGSEHSHHQILGGLVEHLASASHHQITAEKPSVCMAYAAATLLMIFGSYVLFMLLVVLGTRNEILWYERKSKWLIERSAKK